MMNSVICLPPSENAPGQVCFPIYYKIPDKKLHPDPGPEGPWWKLKPDDIVKDNSHFDDAVKKRIVDKQTLVDVATLGAVQQLVSNLSPAIQGHLNEALKKSTEKLNDNKFFIVKL